MTLGGLTKGRPYLVQVWVNDSRGPAAGTQARTQTLDGIVEMKYNVPHANGGLGQYVIGRFTATGPTQLFTIFGDGCLQFNAFQLRAIAGPPQTPQPK